MDTPSKPIRRRALRKDTVAMPDKLDLCHVDHVDTWPLGKVMTRKAKGEGWTDVVLTLIKPIRLGGKYNSRRVRYDGYLYIVHNKRRVYLEGALALLVADKVSHMYGHDAASDAAYNKRLKGY